MTVPLLLNLPRAQYRALMAIASRRGVNAHVLVEGLVAHAIDRALAPAVEPAAIAEPSASQPVVYAPAAKLPPRPRRRPDRERDEDGRLVHVKPEGWEPPLGLEPLPEHTAGRLPAADVAARHERIRVLFHAGFEDPDIAWSAGIKPVSVRGTRSRLGLLRGRNR